MLKSSLIICLGLSLFLGFLVNPVYAAGFEISFEWLKTSNCSGGSPDSEKNPIFKLKNVPKETKVIRFLMSDQDSSFYHGGGKVEYTGQEIIDSGAFTYAGPCPPFTHTYIWTATAKDSTGKTLGRAKAKRKFPE